MVHPIVEPPSALQPASASAEGVVLVLTGRRRFGSGETCELTLISPMKSAQGSVVACIVSIRADALGPSAEAQQRISIGEPLPVRVRPAALPASACFATSGRDSLWTYRVRVSLWVALHFAASARDSLQRVRLVGAQHGRCSEPPRWRGTLRWSRTRCPS